MGIEYKDGLKLLLGGIGYHVGTNLETYRPKIEGGLHGLSKWGGNVWDTYSPGFSESAGNFAKAGGHKAGVIATETGKYLGSIKDDLFQSAFNQVGANIDSGQDFLKKLTTGTAQILSNAPNSDALAGTAIVLGTLGVLTYLGLKRKMNGAGNIANNSTKRRRKTSRRPLDPDKVEPGRLNRAVAKVRDGFPRSKDEIKALVKRF
jgi:hypothetical protein